MVNDNDIYPSRPMNRRTFVTALGGAAAGVLSGQGCGKGMRYRRLGRTGIRTSVIMSDELPEPYYYQRAIDAGVNYWHKMGRWGEPDIFARLDRESYYCDLTIDSTDFDGAVEEFERGLSRAGIGMIDGFKVHSVYDHPEDIREKTGILRAFEHLKSKGKTRFLMLSQHRSVIDILEAAIESDLFDVVQVPVHPLVPIHYFSPGEAYPEYNRDRYIETIRRAHDRDIGVTAMKAVVGGPKNWEKIDGFHEKVRSVLGDDGDIVQALIHWALDVPGVTSFASSMKNEQMFVTNITAAGGRLTAVEQAGIRAFRRVAWNSVCRMCGACERSAPDSVPVADILRHAMYCQAYCRGQRSRQWYRDLPSGCKVSAINDFSSYERACPYGLKVKKMLREAHEILT